MGFDFSSHVIIFEGRGYDYYLWPVVAIWISDRMLRLARVVYCNLHIRLQLGETQSTHSTATYDPASNVVRLEVIPGSAVHQPTASSFYYLYQPFRFRGWESHPFTLGSWEDAVEHQMSHLGTTAAATTETGDDELENSKMAMLILQGSLNGPNSSFGFVLTMDGLALSETNALILPAARFRRQSSLKDRMANHSLLVDTSPFS